MGEAVRKGDAISLPVSLSREEAVAVAVKRLQRDDLDAAAIVLDALVELAPEDADVLHFRGILAHRRNEHVAALQLLQRALDIDPGYVDALNNLGNLHKEMGDLQDARAAYVRAIELQPSHVAAHNNLGVTLRALGHFDTAVEVLLRATELSPDNADILQNLGSAYRSQKDYAKAIDSYRKAIAIRPYNRDAYRYLAFTLYAMNEREKAIALVRQWLEFDPESAAARHLLAAYGGAPQPERADERYVRELFDDFAGSFDQVLRDIHYKAPGLVAERLRAAFPGAAARLAIIDAGCGTGLCGPLVRSQAKTLVGIDLSPKMLAKARSRGVYDRLCEAELKGFLEAAPPASWDAVISADTLCYFGRLEPVFAAAFAALAPSGAFVFTVERDGGEAGGAGFRLNAHGRYSHALAYLERALAAAGFVADAAQSSVLRREMDSPVEGFVITARKR